MQQYYQAIYLKSVVLESNQLHCGAFNVCIVLEAAQCWESDGDMASGGVNIRDDKIEFEL